MSEAIHDSEEKLDKKPPEVAPKTPDARADDGEAAGEAALEGFLKNANNWFEEEVIKAKVESEAAEAEEIERRARENAEKEFAERLESERDAREKAEAEIRIARHSGMLPAVDGEDGPLGSAVPLAEPAPSKTGVYVLVGCVLVALALIFVGIRMGGKSAKHDHKGVAAKVETVKTDVNGRLDTALAKVADQVAAALKECRATPRPAAVPVPRPVPPQPTVAPPTVAPLTPEPMTAPTTEAVDGMSGDTMDREPPRREARRPAAMKRRPAAMKRRPAVRRRTMRAPRRTTRRRPRRTPRRRPMRRGGWENPFG